MAGVKDGNGAGDAEVRDGRVAREARVGVLEGVAEADAAGAPTNGEPTSFELGSNPSNLAPKRQTSLFVK